MNQKTEFDGIYLDKEIGGRFIHPAVLAKKHNTEFSAIYGIVIGSNSHINAYGKDGKTFVSEPLLQELRKKPESVANFHFTVQLQRRTIATNPNPNTLH